MKQVCDTMGVMTKCINQSDDVSRTMLSKYEESAINVNKIETIVGKLMGELGTGGFMGIGDAKPGMKVILIAKNRKLFFHRSRRSDRILRWWNHGTSACSFRKFNRYQKQEFYLRTADLRDKRIVYLGKC